MKPKIVFLRSKNVCKTVGKLAKKKRPLILGMKERMSVATDRADIKELKY